jgi:hypothetical protein
MKIMKRPSQIINSFLNEKFANTKLKVVCWWWWYWKVWWFLEKGVTWVR